MASQVTNEIRGLFSDGHHGGVLLRIVRRGVGKYMTVNRPFREEISVVLLVVHDGLTEWPKREHFELAALG